MTDFTKRERQVLRELAGHVYEAEVALLLEDLATSFTQWRSGEILPSELLQLIHEFHRDQSRELWSMYQGLRECDIVARGLARGLSLETKVPSSIQEKLKALVDGYRL